ncbi:MAG: hypothetical protein ACR2HX_21435 [Pyrinomonadaceae bacterium]
MQPTRNQQVFYQSASQRAADPPALGVNRMTLRIQAKHLYRWLRALWSWLAEARDFWLAVVVVVVAILLVARKGVTEPEIRITGLVLQILGIGTVAWGIRETGVLFGRPDIVRLAREWLRRFPAYGGRVVTGSVNITVPGATMQARGYVPAIAGPSTTVEARVEALEKNVKYINDRIDETQTEMDQKARAQQRDMHFFKRQ